jgi:hypothetical protein
MKRLAALLMLTTLGCTTRVADLTIITPHQAPKSFEVVNEHVEGKDCTVSVLLVPVGNTTPSADATIDDALAQAEGADALVDASFTFDQIFTLFYNRGCMRVEGKAVRTR